jgi:hypothetical protein
MKALPIPENEQLHALSGGLKDVYRLLTSYLGDLNSVPNFQKHITVTKQQLAEYLRHHPELAARHISKSSDPKYQDCPVLEFVDGKYRVYEILCGEARYKMEFNELSDAAAEYLMWRWPN